MTSTLPSPMRPVGRLDISLDAHIHHPVYGRLLADVALTGRPCQHGFQVRPPGAWQRGPV